MRSKSYAVALALLALAGVAGSAAAADTQDALDSLNARQITPAMGAVNFYQTQFVFDAGRSLDSDWGQVSVNIAALTQARLVQRRGGYLNVALYGSGPPAWVVENLRIPPSPDSRGDGISASALIAERISPTVPQPPMTTHFDLRPGTEGSGRVQAVVATVLVSDSPLPPITRVASLIEQVPPVTFLVQQHLVNAEGDLGEGTAPPPPVGPLLLGPPPQPITPVPELPDDLAFPLEVTQYDQPNINAGKNQCMPMAHALVIGYLRIRYNHPPLAWPLPHYSSAGIGLQVTAGDVIFWTPVPSSSRIAQIDARTRRVGVLDFDTGGGSDRCQHIRAAFSYMATQGAPGQIVYRHQGGSAAYGAGETCDNGDVLLPLGDVVSVRQGANPTWQFIFDQLQLGRGLFMSFGRYDVDGNRTGGHAVRIWGARRFAGRDYIYTLDDGTQGNNNTGLRTEQWEVADNNTPGTPGVPNGRLELGGTSSEIELVVSAEAKPTLLIP
jgi:hypothetical protein